MNGEDPFIEEHHHQRVAIAQCNPFGLARKVSRTFKSFQHFSLPLHHLPRNLFAFIFPWTRVAAIRKMVKLALFQTALITREEVLNPKLMNSLISFFRFNFLFFKMRTNPFYCSVCLVGNSFALEVLRNFEQCNEFIKKIAVLVFCGCQYYYFAYNKNKTVIPIKKRILLHYSSITCRINVLWIYRFSQTGLQWLLFLHRTCR